ncbi:hypothetical protein SLEP1_g14338 [Rubroshorea leprosula]|uniref:Uncharacterized protein n=1 Tax=Rubroshorea leprosula TaxID=152421 RepID=A0AAV5IT59_9ROSI|nr:hypothetical protein SLEP1_g14338 [Rubroshorea leprosula]
MWIREFLPCTAAGFFPLLGPVSTAGELWYVAASLSASLAI